MFGRALEKIIDQLIAKLSSVSLGWPLLLVMGAIGGSYLTVAQFRSDPTAIDTIVDWRFLSALTVIVVIFSGLMVVRYASPRRIVRIALLLLLVSGASTIWWHYIRIEETLFQIDVVLDGTLDLQRTEVATFISDVQQPHIQVTLLTRQLTSGSICFRCQIWR